MRFTSGKNEKNRSDFPYKIISEEKMLYLSHNVVSRDETFRQIDDIYRT